MDKVSGTWTESEDEVLIYVYRKEEPKKEKVFAKEVEAVVIVDQLRNGEIVGVEVLFHTKPK